MLIIGDEALHLINGLWIYNYIDHSWHKVFQILLWILMGLFVIVMIFKGAVNSALEKIKKNLYRGISRNSFYYLLIFLGIIALFSYFYLLRNMTYSLILIRYPPAGKLLYFLIYSAFGINHIFPRIIQLIFYLLCAIYLYRTICLFHEKQAALLVAAIYLFLPISFAYAYLAELESGVIFFIVAISFYFLRFIKNRDNRDLFVSAYLIGIGFLYKDPVFLVFPVCFIFLVFHKVKNPHLFSMVHLKIFSLALVPVVPWMIITKLFSWRNYTFQLSNLTSFEGKIADYFSVMSLNLSEIVFILFVLSFIYFCFFKRNILTVFYGFLFIVYYFFIISDMGSISPRFSMAFYPTITIFISLFIITMIQNIKWKYSVNLFSILLISYLIVISSMLPTTNRFLTIENRKLFYFPSEKAMKWVDRNVKDGEKILTVRILSADFYRVKFGIDKHKIIALWYELNELYPPEKLREFSREKDVSYIMFPYNKYLSNQVGFEILQYLKNNHNNEFRELETFNIDENYIYIYKIIRP
jgi:hypothetical protein